MVHSLLNEADKKLPKEATAILRPHIEATYWKGIAFTATHVAKLAAHVGIRRGGVFDPRYCVEERKLKRVFYTPAGINKLREAVATDPMGALRSFAARSAIERYETEISMMPISPLASTPGTEPTKGPAADPNLERNSWFKGVPSAGSLPSVDDPPPSS